jgi:hypothetical protein
MMTGFVQIKSQFSILVQLKIENKMRQLFATYEGSNKLPYFHTALGRPRELASHCRPTF